MGGVWYLQHLSPKATAMHAESLFPRKQLDIAGWETVNKSLGYFLFYL